MGPKGAPGADKLLFGFVEFHEPKIVVVSKFQNLLKNYLPKRSRNVVFCPSSRNETLWYSCCWLDQFLHVPGPAGSVQFALLSDAYRGPLDGRPKRISGAACATSINDSIAFVILTGDITELGRNEELALARRILDSLRVPYPYYSRQPRCRLERKRGQQFLSTFGSDVFSFEFAGIRFLGCPSGPYLRMSDGHDATQCAELARPPA